MRHLVTGGCGFLGHLIAKNLLKRGEKVRVLDIWKDPELSPEIEFIQCDIRNREGLRSALRGIDIVHHNVALVPLTKAGKEFWEVNVVGSQIAAEEAASAGVKAFIHMSSSAIFGIPKQLPITLETAADPAEIYGRAKWAGEQAVRAACEKARLPLVVIRPRTILGQGRLGIFQILFDWIQESRSIYILGDGNNLFQFLHADDLMAAYMLAYEKNRPGAYNIGTDRYGTLREALGHLIQHAGSRSKIVSIPSGPAIAALTALDYLRLSPLAPWHYLTYHKPFYFDLSPIQALGWKARYSNDEMLRESFDWFRKHGKEGGAGPRASAHRKPVQEKILSVLKKFS